VIIRQAHPGEKRGRYPDYGAKLESAREYKQLENIDWPVLADDYEGTVHRAYSREMADPSFLIDAEGRVSFYCMWTHAPSLKPAFDELLARDGVGAPVAGGIDRIPHRPPPWVLACSAISATRPSRSSGRSHYAPSRYHLRGRLLWRWGFSALARYWYSWSSGCCNGLRQE
jgi:hypothetical protein